MKVISKWNLKIASFSILLLMLIVAGTLSPAAAQHKSSMSDSSYSESDSKDLMTIISSFKSIKSKLVINEVELNPRGNDVGKEWIELYNPSSKSVNISDFRIKTSFKSVLIVLPPDVTIGSQGVYLIKLDRQILSNTAEVLTLTDPSGKVIDKTPSLVDRKEDNRTWQRIPDGNNEWKFTNDSRNKLNSPEMIEKVIVNDRNGNSAITSSNCEDQLDCIEGYAYRIVDGDTLYVKDGKKIYKVNLALVNASGTEDGLVTATAFTRELCLGSDVLVDLDEVQSSKENILGVVYCSSDNLNEELLIGGYAILDLPQCDISEFADSKWAKEAGC